MKITLIIITIIVLLLMGISELFKLKFLRTFLVSVTFISLTALGQVTNICVFPYEISMTITIIAMIGSITGIIITRKFAVTRDDYWPILFKRLFIFMFLFLGASLLLLIFNPEAFANMT